ncbi:hypothetical protein AB1286_02525 [Trinickia sp. NRRL B-1857]|uniref:hypothetical protein n=1 Tax=Trinickia sp. NRRL B-1857 TaxID=3162879 RepID=UPI003D279C37
MTLEPGSIVCKITAASELVCSQVTSHDRSVLSALHHWQDLLGAFLGAVIGIVGALIVASATKRRSRNIAALLLLPDLKSYMSITAVATIPTTTTITAVATIPTAIANAAQKRAGIAYHGAADLDAVRGHNRPSKRTALRIVEQLFISAIRAF